MPVETSATYISDLVPDWPIGASDFVKEGDDHFRLIKKVLQNTFPNITQAITGTGANLDALSTGLTWVPADPDAWNTGHWRIGTPDSGGGGAMRQMLVTQAAQTERSMYPNQLVCWADIMNVMYPIHRVIVSTNSANPATYLGFGTWTQRAGAVYGVGSCTDVDGVTDSFALGEITGWFHPHFSQLHKDTMTVTVDEEKDHTHPFSYSAVNSNNGHYGDTGYGGTAVTNSGTTKAGTPHKHTAHIDLPGTGASYRLPGRGYYVWERTA